jgi:hypothetical protein
MYMIVKRRIIIKESKYKRELTTISRNSNLSVCEFYKCKYRDVDRRCVDRKKQQCRDCENLNYKEFSRRYTSYFFIHQ